METKWNDQEDAALRGLSMLSQLIYLRVFRRHMDYATGIAGLRYRIDYQTICDAVGFIPDPGSKKRRWIPTKEEVRSAVNELERVLPERPIPLLVEAGSGPHRGYLKSLPLATVDQSAQKGNPAGTPHEPRKMNPAESNTKTSKKSDEDQSNTPDEQHGEPRSKKNAAPAMNPTPPDTGIPEEIGSAKALVEFAVREPDAPAKSEPVESLPVRAVFDYWRQTMNHPQAKLDPKRRRAIAGRLKAGYSVEVLKQAVDGCKASPWHQGKNKDRRVYDDIELICRDAVKVEQFLKHVQQQQTRDSELDAWLNDGHDNVIEGVCRHV